MGFIREVRRDIEHEAIRLVREYHAHLIVEAKRLCGDDSVAEDLAMKTIEVYMSKPEGDLPPDDKALAYLKSILKNIYHDSIRGKAQARIVYLDPEDIERLDELGPADNSTEAAILAHSDAELVRSAIARLPESARSVIVMHYFESLSVRQIAELLKKTPDSVKSNLYYARKVLARRLGKVLGRSAPAIAALLFGGSLLYAAAVATGIVPSPFTAPDLAPAKSAEQANGDSPQEPNGDSPQQTEAITASSDTNTGENAMNTQSVKSAAVNTLAAFTLAGLTAQANSPDQAIPAPVFAQNGLVAANADNVWTYDSSTNPKTISNGNWTITLINDYTDIANGAIQLYNITAGSGVLDLRNMTVDGSAITSIKFHSNTGAYATSWKTWDISDFLIDAFDSVAADGHNTLTFGTNPNLKNIEITGGNVTSIDGFASMTGLTNALIRLPNLVKLGSNANSGFYNCTALKKVVLGCPNLTWMGQNIYTGCNSLEGDIGDYIPATVTNFHQNAQYSATSVTGTLVLDNLKSANFQSFAGVSNVKITYTGTNLYNTSPFNGRNVLKDVTYIAPGCTNMLFNGSYVWNNCNSITNVTLYIPKVEAVYRWPSSVKTYWFQNEALSAEIVNGICTFSGTGMRTIATYGTIYCSKRMGWKALATEMTADEEAAAPEGCFGVFKALNSYNQPYGMWMVHRDSPYDKRTGSVYFFR